MFCLNCSLKLHFYYTFLSVFSDIFLWRVFNVRAKSYLFTLFRNRYSHVFRKNYFSFFSQVKSCEKDCTFFSSARKKLLLHTCFLSQWYLLFFRNKNTTKRSSMHDQSYQVGNTEFWHILIHRSAYITRHQNH